MEAPSKSNPIGRPIDRDLFDIVIPMLICRHAFQIVRSRYPSTFSNLLALFKNTNSLMKQLAPIPGKLAKYAQVDQAPVRS